MRYRKKVSGGKSKRMFRRTSKPKSMNHTIRTVKRGGWRL